MSDLMIILLTPLLMTAVYTDLRWSRIPNWLTFSAMGVGMVVHAWMYGFSGALVSVAGCALGMGLFLLPYACRAIGAGDVKLVAGIGSIVGPAGIVSVAALSVLAGGIYALGVMGYQWGIVAASRKLAYATYGTLASGGSTGAGDFQLPYRLRYGLAIAVGTLLFLGGVQPFGG